MPSLPSGHRVARRSLLLSLTAAAASAATAAVPAANAAPVVTTASGANTAAIQAAVDGFRTSLGTLNPNNGQSFTTGRREINWDGVPDLSSSPNAFPAGFFSTTSPRGVLFSTPGTGFRVSATVGPVRFGELDASYTAEFSTFSPQRLFTPIGSNVTDVVFQVPGTQTPASTTGFGVVLTDVDTAGSAKLEAFDVDGQLLQTVAAPASPDHGLAFAAVTFNAGERIARVRVTSGTKALGAPEAGNDDLVVMDDLLYAEPQKLEPRVAPAPVEVKVPVPGPTVEVPAPVAPDKTAPRLSLLALSGYRAVLGASESCTYTATLTLDATTAKRLKLQRTLATHRSTKCVAGSTVITSKLSRATVARLCAAKARPVLTVTARDAAKNGRTIALKLS
jgi:hypothetical protein